MSVFHSLSDEWRLVIIRRDAYTVCSSLWLSELMAAGSVAAKLWDRYIRPIEDPPSHPMFVLQTVWIFICPILCACVSALMSLVCKFMGVLGYRCISVVLRAYCRSRLLTQTNQKPWLLLMPPFPRQRLPGSDCKSLPLCFSALSSAVRPILHCQSAAAAVCGIN